MSAPILVIGPNGTMGREVVASLLARGARVRVLARNPTPGLPAKIETISGDLKNAQAVSAAFSGVSAAFYVAPHAEDEEHVTRLMLRACESASARLVFAGPHADGDIALTRFLQRVLITLLAPHYAGKFRSSERARQAKTRTVILAPTNFAQNDELFREELLGGTFSQPLGHKGTNRVDVRDLGDAAARALMDSDFPAGFYPVIGPETLTGPRCAEIWSHALQREVLYTGDSDDWMRTVEKKLSGQKRSDFIDTFRLLPKYEMPTRPAHLQITRELLGRAPRPYAQYVSEAVARWRATEPERPR